MLKKVILLLVLLIMLIWGTTSRSQDSHDDGKSLIYGPQSGPLSGSTDYLEIQEPSGPITLWQSLQLALIRNPELAAFSWGVRAREALKLQAGLYPNPEIEAEVEEFAGTGELTGFDSAATTIQLSQVILLGGKRSKAVEVARKEWELAGWGYESKRLDVLSETAKGFVDVLTAQDRLRLSEDLFNLSQGVYDVVAERVRAGKVSPVEQSKARVSLTNSEIKLEQARRDLEAARKRLAAMWGSSEPVFEHALGNLDNIEEPPPLENLFQWTERNPDLARWQAQIERDRAALKLAKSEVIPDVTVSGGVQRFNGSDQGAYIVGVSVPVPLFNRNQGNIQAAGHELSRSEENRRAEDIRIKTELARTWQDLAASYRAAVALREDALPAARHAFDSTREGFRLGKFEYLEVLDAQRTLFETEGRYLSVLGDYHRTRVEVERLIGTGIESVNRTGTGSKEQEE